MTERQRLLTSIERLKIAQNAAKEAARKAREDIEREQREREGQQRPSRS